MDVDILVGLEGMYEMCLHAQFVLFIMIKERVLYLR